MADGDTATVEIIGTRGDYFLTSGKGFQGKVELALSPQGMLDVPITTIWNETAFGWGARWGGMRYNRRDLVLGFNILGDTASEWQDNNDSFRSNWSYTEDSTIRVTTEKWGTRELRCRLTEATEEKMERDPRIWGKSELVLTLTAGWPFWTQEDDTYEFETVGSAQSFTFPGVNETDMPAYPVFVLDAPGIWTLSDRSYGSDEWGRFGIDANRNITMPALTSVGITVNYDPTEETIVADDGSQIWGLLQSEPLYAIPPQAGIADDPVNLPVSVTGASAGAACQVRIPRNFQRPWGLAG